MTISNSDDIIDSRDVIKRIAALEDERFQLQALVDTASDGDDPDADLTEAQADLAEWDAGDDAEELKALQALAAQGESYADDWRHGATLINDSYFTEYAQQLAEDIGAIGKDAPWPACHIDWDAAADALKTDYTSIDFDGTAYWVR